MSKKIIVITTNQKNMDRNLSSRDLKMLEEVQDTFRNNVSIEDIIRLAKKYESFTITLPEFKVELN